MILNPYRFGAASDPIAVSLLAKMGGWWEMDEASGTRNDSIGSAHLTETGGTVTTATGVRGGSDVAASFTRDPYLTTPSSAVLQVPAGGGDHCMFGWFWSEVPAFEEGRMMRKGGGSANEYTGAILSGSARFGTTAAASAAISNEQWYFFVGWREAADSKSRLSLDNGTPVVSTTTTSPSPGTSALTFGDLYVGRMQRWGWIKGDFLTADERTWLFNAGAGRTYAEIVALAG